MEGSIRISDGHRGNRTETGTTALTSANGGPWTEIHVIEAATFTTLTDLQDSGGDAATGIAYPALFVLKGYFTAVTLTSGKVRLYK